MRRVTRTSQRAKAGHAWTAREEQRLRELYPLHGNRVVASRLKRSEWAIIGKARNLGLSKDHGYRRQRSGPRAWSTQETNRLRMLYPTLSEENIADRLGRSRNAVHMRARRLRLRKIAFWSEREDQILCDLYLEHDYEHIAQLLGRTVSAVKARCITLQLKAKSPTWTEAETRFLRDLYKIADLDAIAKNLGRTRAATAKKARQMGLVKYRHWSAEDLRTLRELWPSSVARQVEERLGRPYAAIRRKARGLGLCEHSRALEPRPTDGPPPEQTT